MGFTPEDIMYRLVLWLCIPWRICKELYDTFICVPKCHPDEPGPSGPSAHSKDKSVDAVQEKLWAEEAALERWWNPNFPLATLKLMNPSRTKLVAEAYLKEMMGLENTWKDSVKNTARPLAGARVIDVGCGGGILSEALHDAGAEVTGVDMMPLVINVAKRHWEETRGNETGPEYLCVPMEELCEQRPEAYDVVMCSEVLEHVLNPELFVEYCCKMVKPGGCVVFTTINRSIMALLLVIIFFEDVIGLLPHGLHHMYMCVKPEEIDRAVKKMGFRTIRGCGKIPYPLGFSRRNLSWFSTSFMGMGYAVICKRND